jgi:hypothetical protein
MFVHIVHFSWKTRELHSRQIVINCPACHRIEELSKAYESERTFYLMGVPLFKHPVCGIKCGGCKRRFATVQTAFELCNMTPAQLSQVLESAPPDSKLTRIGSLLSLITCPFPYIPLFLALVCFYENWRLGLFWRMIGLLSIVLSFASTAYWIYVLIR